MPFHPFSKLPPGTQFFDIETGGLEAAKSQILSLTYGNATGGYKSLYSKITPGSFISRWADDVVVSQIMAKRGIARQSEQELLTGFLKNLQGLPAGSTIAGWNIGYGAAAQTPWSVGFDIPFVMSRAGRYDLTGQFKTAFSRLNVRDVGREFLTRSALRLHRFTQSLPQGEIPKWFEADVWKQIEPYGRKAAQLRRGGASIPQIARQLSGMKVHGWKQELAYELMTGKKLAGAHMSEADVMAMSELAGSMSRMTDAEFATKWNKLATKTRLISSVKAAASRGRPIPWDDVFSRASRFGIDTGALKAEAQRELKYVAAAGKMAFRSPTVRGALGFLGRHKGKLALGALGVAVGAAYLAKPLGQETEEERALRTGSIVNIPGFGGAYNSIPGMHKHGLGAAMRRSNTPFGSPYSLGPRDQDLPEDYYRDLRRRFTFFARALRRSGEKAGTAHKRILIPSNLLTQSNLEELGFVPTKIAIPERGQSSWTTWRHPFNRFHLHRHGEYWTMHKDEHHSSTMLAKRRLMKHKQASFTDRVGTQVASFFEGLPHLLTEGVPGIYYYLKGAATGAPPMRERLLADIPRSYFESLQGMRAIRRRTLIEEGILSFSGLKRWLMGDDEQNAETMSGLDAAGHNIIQGMPDGGLNEMLRHQETPFGSGSRQDRQRSAASYIYPVAAGTAAGFGTFAAISPQGLGSINISKYPRLQKMREAGMRGGFAMISEMAPRDFDPSRPLGSIFRAENPIGSLNYYLLAGGLNPVKDPRALREFAGVAFINDRVLGKQAKYKHLAKAYVANWGDWLIGGNKLATWDYFIEKGVKDLHAETIAVSDAFKFGVEGFAGPTAAGEAFFKRHGGPKGAVLKHAAAARGTGVWLDLSEGIESQAEDIVRNPQKYILQEKLDLAEEFRVVTAGDYPIHTTYRFGSSKVRKLAKKLGFTPTKELLKGKKGKVSPFEIIQPVFDRDLKDRIESFATQVSKELPYEVGALDIGLTKSGQFKLIEAQRVFGNLSNPVVGERLKSIITNKPGRFGLLAVGAAAIAGFGIVNAIFGDDEGVRTSREAPVDTDFGSPWKGPIVSGPVSKIFAKANPAHLNYLDGLLHGGMNEAMRHAVTPFGGALNWLKNLAGKKLSGKALAKEGAVIVPEGLRKFFSAAHSGAVGRQVHRKALGIELGKIKGEIVKAGHSLESYTKELDQLLTLTERAQKEGFEHVAWLRNPVAEGKGVFAHEQTHQLTAMLGLREQLSSRARLLPEEFKAVMKSRGYADVPEHWFEEYLAYSRQYMVEGVPQKAGKMFDEGIKIAESLPDVTPSQILKMSQEERDVIAGQFREALKLNTPPPLPVQSVVKPPPLPGQRSRQMADATRAAQEQIFSAANRGGKGHRRFSSGLNNKDRGL